MNLIFEKLDSNPDKAAEKFFSLHRRLARFFNRRGLPEQDAEDAASEVMMRVNRNLSKAAASGEWNDRESDSQIRRVELYCFGVARRLRYEIYREFNRYGELPETLSAFHDPARMRFIEQQSQFIRRCIKRVVPPADHDWFEQYAKADYGEKRLIAEALNVPEEALRVRYHRLLKKVKSRCQERLYGWEFQNY